jgi:hypothetical protein
LQLVRRLGESGSLQLLVREQGSTADSPRELALDNWLKGLMSRIRFDRWVFAHGVRRCRRCWPSSIRRAGTGCWPENR